MSDKGERISLGLNLDDYRYDARHYPGQGQDRLIDFNYIEGTEFSLRCPSWQYMGFDTYGAVGKSSVVYDLIKGKLEYSSPTVQDVAYKCQMCGSCDVGAKRNLDCEFQLMFESLRARLVEKGYGPMPQHAEVTRNIETCHNRFGKDQTRQQDWILKEIKVARQAETLYFVGCRSAFANTKLARSTAMIMNAANVPFMVMKDERCCGNFIYTTGQVEKAKRIAEENLRLIRETAAKTVVFSCAECYKTIKVDYPKLLGFSTSDLGFEVKHITEMADGWIKDGRLNLQNRIDMKVTYHDPCNLGRMSEPWYHWEGERKEWGIFDPPRTVRRGMHGVYEPPRNILKAIPGLETVEMVRHHENAWCAGGGAGVKEAFPEFAMWTAKERMREAAATGSEAIVSCSPECQESFINTSMNGMKVYDITELVVKAIAK